MAERTLTNAAGGDQEAALRDVLDTPQAGPRAIRGAGLRVGSYVTATLLTLISAPLLTRHLGSVRFGQYYVVVALVALVGGLTEGGLGTIGLREYAMLAGSARERFMRNLLGMRLAFSSIGALGAVGFAALADYPAAMLAGTAVAGLGIVIATVQSTLAVPIYSSLRIGRQVAMELLTQVLTVTLVVLGVLAGAGILPFLAIPVPAGLFLLGWTFLYVRGEAPVWPAFAVAQWRSVFRETYPVAASTAVQTLYLRSVILIMSLVAGKLAVGTYALSIRVMEILAGIPLLLVTTAFPIVARAARDDRQRLRYVIQRMFDTGLVVGVGMAVPTMLAAGFIMSVLVGNGGGMAASVLRIQAPALLLTFLSVGAGSVLIVTRRHRALLLSTVVGGLWCWFPSSVRAVAAWPACWGSSRSWARWRRLCGPAERRDSRCGRFLEWRCRRRWAWPSSSCSRSAICSGRWPFASSTAPACCSPEPFRWRSRKPFFTVFVACGADLRPSRERSGHGRSAAGGGPRMCTDQE